jgi:serine/threonine-protein kinase
LGHDAGVAVDLPSADCPDEESLAAFVGGALAAGELARLEAHMARCAACRAVVADAAHGVYDTAERAPAAVAETAGEASRPSWSAVALRPGDLVAGTYRVEELLGSGGMGVVLAARHVVLGHRVAIKVLHHAGPLADTRFFREARTCGRLANEHIPRVFDIGRLSGGAPFIVMEYLVGKDLARVAAAGPIAIADAIGYVRQACAGLGEAHRAGIIHRDVKPANLFLTSGSGGAPLVKVLDFGISKAISDDDAEGAHTLTSTGTVLGSPLYMSPEQVRATKDVDARTDIWSLGAILYELLTGRPPFRGPTLAALAVAIATEREPAPSSLRPELPSEVERIVERCLEKDRGARFASMAALEEALAGTDGAPAAAGGLRARAKLGAIAVGTLAATLGVLAATKGARRPDPLVQAAAAATGHAVAAAATMSPPPPPAPATPPPAEPVKAEAPVAAPAAPALRHGPRSGARAARPPRPRHLAPPVGPLDTPD